MDADVIRQYLEFYQDLGIKTLYRQPAGLADESVSPTSTETVMELPPFAPAGDTF